MSKGTKLYEKPEKNLSPLGAWAFAIGTSIGWGSLVVTNNSYLGQAGPAGMSEYEPGVTQKFKSVFEKADKLMYEEKKLLKSLGAATRL